LVPTNTSGKTEQQGSGSNQYGGKLISTNTEKNILRETVPTKTAGHWFQSIRQEIGSNQYSGKRRTTGNWFQPIRREIDSKQYSGKYYAQKSSTQYGRRREIGSNQYRELIPTNTAGKWF
jgi:hypothetical protein